MSLLGRLGRVLDQVIYLKYHRAEIKVLVRLDSSMETLGEESTFKPIDIVSRIHFLAVLRLRSPFSCWLSDILSSYGAPT